MAGKRELNYAALRQKTDEERRLVETAAGRRHAELVLKNARYVNVFTHELCTGDIAIACGKIAGIGKYDGEKELDVSGRIVCPGFLDAHIHIESSLSVPREFARAVVPHGTTAIVTDPHEITNVMGTDGIEYMLEATERLPIDVFFMLPSCVPATPLDESGAELDWFAIDRFYAHPRVLGLAEMMNYVGVCAADEAVLAKLAAARLHGKRIDGHAPGLSGGDLQAYAAAGVRSDHECFAIDDAREKLRAGQYIMIRDGTAAKNLEALVDLLKQPGAERCMLCTDDKHPVDLLKLGHIDYIIKKAIARGVDPITAVTAATRNPAEYFGLTEHGAVAPGYRADLAIIDSFEHFEVQTVLKDGRVTYENGALCAFAASEPSGELSAEAHDTFRVRRLRPEDFAGAERRAVIGMVPGEIVSTDNGYAEGVDPERDILKIAVVERHKGTGHIGLGYLQGYGLKRGAVATSISHDSHNIIAVGTNDADLAAAVNRVVENCGGIVVAEDGAVRGEVVLEIAGLMSEAPLTAVNDTLERAKEAAFALGVNRGVDPFMTLSFMSLPVIPALRLTTRGMVDVLTQKFV